MKKTMMKALLATAAMGSVMMAGSMVAMAVCIHQSLYR